MAPLKGVNVTANGGGCQGGSTPQTWTLTLLFADGHVRMYQLDRGSLGNGDNVGDNHNVRHPQHGCVPFL
jgi:hypothetical protein